MIVLNREISDILDNLKKGLDKRIESKLKQMKFVKHIPAIALSEENSDGYVTVRLVTDNEQTINILNKSNEAVSINDTVIVEYSNSLSNAYITKVNGKKVPFSCFVVVQTEEEAKTDFIPDKLYIVLEENT